MNQLMNNFSVMNNIFNTVKFLPDNNVTLEKKFYGEIAEYSNDKFTKMADGVFCNCSNLMFIDLPSCTTIGNSVFKHCTSLRGTSFPVCTTIGNAAFYNCTSLTSVSFPACTTIEKNAFQYCSSLTSANFPVCTTIESSAFYNCTSLTNLTLAGSSVATLTSTNAFFSTPMLNSTYTGTFGSIYVPASLVASYQAKSNWSTYSQRITSIV